MIRVTGLKVRVEDTGRDLRDALADYLRISPSEIEHIEVVRRSLDARNKARFFFVYTLNAELAKGVESRPVIRKNPVVKVVERQGQEEPCVFSSQPSPRPVVVGMGPAGLFAALTLAKAGACPLVIERGREVEKRVKDVSLFWDTGTLDTGSNVQFGEGGAGTFSDGKLTTRIDDPRVRSVLATLVEMGAPDDIMYNAKPHVGTDRLRAVVRRLRDRLTELGAEVRFGACLDGIEAVNGRLTGIRIGSEPVEAGNAVLALGNAARDTFSMLIDAGVHIAPKPFAIGVRVEHPRELIDGIQYGPYAGHPVLGAADYMLTCQDRKSGRAAYSFCMCPGGEVVAGASEHGGVVVNGMSYRARDGANSNSALVVTVGPDDFGPGPLGGVEFQRRWEVAAYALGGGGYTAPAQDVESFLAGRPGGETGIASYRPKVLPADLSKCLPGYVTDTLRRAVVEFDRRMKGYNHARAVLTGVETRTSSPVRITRGDDFQSVTVKGIYPCGEGSGYAGGIISSAVDGIKAAERLIKDLQ